MNVSAIASVVFVSLVGIAACTDKEQENVERSAACADRTNGVSCMGCCETPNYAFTDAKCICKGAHTPKAK